MKGDGSLTIESEMAQLHSARIAQTQKAQVAQIKALQAYVAELESALNKAIDGDLTPALVVLFAGAAEAYEEVRA